MTKDTRLALVKADKVRELLIARIVRDSDGSFLSANMQGFLTGLVQQALLTPAPTKRATRKV